eukprot:gene12636-biopygen9065
MLDYIGYLREKSLFAAPSTFRDVLQYMKTLLSLILLRLAWMAASRWAEVAAFTKESFRPLDDKVPRLDGGTHPKTSKEQPNRSFRFTLFSERFSNRLRKLLDSSGPGQPLTNLSSSPAL